MEDLPLPVFPNSQTTGTGVFRSKASRCRSSISSENDSNPNHDLRRSSMIEQKLKVAFFGSRTSGRRNDHRHSISFPVRKCVISRRTELTLKIRVTVGNSKHNGLVWPVAAFLLRAFNGGRLVGVAVSITNPRQLTFVAGGSHSKGSTSVRLPPPRSPQEPIAWRRLSATYRR